MSSLEGYFDSTTLNALLKEVGDGLAKRGTAASIYVFGGAALMLRDLREGLTEDIDAATVDNESLQEVIAEVGEKYALPQTWFNTTGYGFTSGEETDKWADIFCYESLTVKVASEKALLAHKLTAFRAKDIDDIRQLISSSQIQSVDDALHCVEEMYDTENFVPHIDLEDIRHTLRTVFPLLAHNESRLNTAVEIELAEAFPNYPPHTQPTGEVGHPNPPQGMRY